MRETVGCTVTAVITASFPDAAMTAMTADNGMIIGQFLALTVTDARGRTYVFRASVVFPRPQRTTVGTRGPARGFRASSLKLCTALQRFVGRAGNATGRRAARAAYAQKVRSRCRRMRSWWRGCKSGPPGGRGVADLAMKVRRHADAPTRGSSRYRSAGRISTGIPLQSGLGRIESSAQIAQAGVDGQGDDGRVAPEALRHAARRYNVCAS